MELITGSAFTGVTSKEREMDKNAKENLGHCIRLLADLKADAETYRERKELSLHYHKMFRYWEVVLSILLDHGITVHEGWDAKRIRHEMIFFEDCYAIKKGYHLRTA